MMARWLCNAMISALLFGSGLFGSGCCCVPCGNGPCGPCYVFKPCLPCLPRPIVWNGCNNECSANCGQSCGDYCGPCAGCGIFSQGLFPWVRNGLSCRRGCSDIYFNEWISDPPDCCDPCDKCFGQFTGQRGPCCLGPCQRILAAIHGYRYCPPPYCGPWRPILGCCNQCGPVCGGGDAACSGCAGGAAHGADIYYDGAAPAKTTTAPKGEVMPPAESTSILDENWDVPKVKPEPGKPIHNAQQPPRNQVGRRTLQQPTPNSSRTAPSSYRAAVGAGVRQANYDR